MAAESLTISAPSGPASLDVGVAGGPRRDEALSVVAAVVAEDRARDLSHPGGDDLVGEGLQWGHVGLRMRDLRGGGGHVRRGAEHRVAPPDQVEVAVEAPPAGARRREPRW